MYGVFNRGVHLIQKKKNTKTLYKPFKYKNSFV